MNGPADIVQNNAAERQEIASAKPDRLAAFQKDVRKEDVVETSDFDPFIHNNSDRLSRNLNGNIGKHKILDLMRRLTERGSEFRFPVMKRIVEIDAVSAFENQIGKTAVSDEVVAGTPDSNRLTGTFEDTVRNGQILKHDTSGIGMPCMAGSCHKRIISGGNMAVGDPDVPSAEEVDSGSWQNGASGDVRRAVSDRRAHRYRNGRKTPARDLR